jgi:hypothetical protein
MAPGSLVILASTPMLAESNYFVDLKVLIDLAMLYVLAFYGNHRGDNNLTVINAGCRTYI